jgi:hypothetical protein
MDNTGSCIFTAKGAKNAKKKSKALRSFPKDTGTVCGLRGSFLQNLNQNRRLYKSRGLSPLLIA